MSWHWRISPLWRRKTPRSIREKVQERALRCLSQRQGHYVTMSRPYFTACPVPVFESAFDCCERWICWHQQDQEGPSAHQRYDHSDCGFFQLDSWRSGSVFLVVVIHHRSHQRYFALLSRCSKTQQAKGVRQVRIQDSCLGLQQLIENCMCRDFG